MVTIKEEKIKMNPNLKFNQYCKSGAIMSADGWVAKNEISSKHVSIDWLPVLVVIGIIILVVVVIL
jgi:hypothetical protein